MAPLGATDAYLRLQDTDGDTIEFYLTREGILQEWVNGKLELPHVRSLSYIKRTGLVKDDTGEFNIRAGECDQKAIVLQAMARIAGVRWRGGEYISVTEVCINLVDGDRVIFRISETTGKLQEYVNGKLSLEEVLQLTYNKYLSSITDQDWDFRIRPDECVEKVFLLRHLCLIAGVPWNGDNPRLWTKQTSTVGRLLPHMATSGPGEPVQRQKQAKDLEQFPGSVVKTLFKAPREQSMEASLDHLREAQEIVEAKAYNGSGGGWLDELDELERIAAELKVQRRLELGQQQLKVAADGCTRECETLEESKPLQETMEQETADSPQQQACETCRELPELRAHSETCSGKETDSPQQQAYETCRDLPELRALSETCSEKENISETDTTSPQQVGEEESRHQDACDGEWQETLLIEIEGSLEARSLDVCDGPMKQETERETDGIRDVMSDKTISSEAHSESLVPWEVHETPAAGESTCVEDTQNCILIANEPCPSEAAPQTIERCEEEFNVESESDLRAAGSCDLCEADENLSRLEASSRELLGELDNCEHEVDLVGALESRDTALDPYCFADCDREEPAVNIVSYDALLNEDQSCEKAGLRVHWTMEESPYADLMTFDFDDKPSDSCLQLAEERIPDVQGELNQLEERVQANGEVDAEMLQSLCEKGMLSESMLAPRGSDQTHTIEGWELLLTSQLSDDVASQTSQLSDDVASQCSQSSESVASQLGTEWFTLGENDAVSQADENEEVIHCEETTADNYVQYFLLSDEEDVDESLGFTEL